MHIIYMYVLFIIQFQWPDKQPDDFEGIVDPDTWWHRIDENINFWKHVFLAEQDQHPSVPMRLHPGFSQHAESPKYGTLNCGKV